jgi:hypothetical protein
MSGSLAFPPLQSPGSTIFEMPGKPRDVVPGSVPPAVVDAQRAIGAGRRPAGE